MRIYLEEIDKNQGLLELFRIISSGSYQLVASLEDKLATGQEDLLLVSRFFSATKDARVETKLLRNGQLVGQAIEYVDRIEVKIDSLKKKKDVATKKSILRAVGEKLPWGILTGIRPSKVVHKLLDQDLDLDRIRSILGQEYLIRQDKVDLLVDICLDQRPYLKANSNKYSLYIGIPFCPSRCIYCSFPSMQLGGRPQVGQDYVKSLIYEMEETRLLMGDNINTIYIGGGTPTALEVQDLERVIVRAREIFGPVAELTVEAGRPDTLNRAYLEMLKKNKVDRISINPQTMNDSGLKIIGRNHTSQDIINIYRLARELGLDNINMDLIVGLPGEGYKEFKASLDMIEELDPDSLTIHSLAVKTNSKFARLLDNYSQLANQEAEKIFSLIKDYTSRMGLRPYYLYRQKNLVGNLENIGYAKDRPCIYNISMMEERETIIGLGLGSVSKIVHGDKVKRVANFKSLEDYSSRLDEQVDKKRKYLDLGNL